jgi:hypothetical protein
MPDQGLLARLWGAGFLPSKYQGVQFRSAGDPVLHLSNPAGITRERRRALLDGLAALNKQTHERVGGSRIDTRIAQYEMAFRMQTSVPELLDTAGEPDHVYKLYGDERENPGRSRRTACSLGAWPNAMSASFSFITADGITTVGLPTNSRFWRGTRSTGSRPDSRSEAARIARRHARDLGRRVSAYPYSQGTLKPDNYGRDHHGRVFSMWMAGRGHQARLHAWEFRRLRFNVAEGGVHVHDLQATILHLLGIGHEKLTYLFQGRQFRLTDVAGNL